MTMILEIEEGKEAAAREKILEMLNKENIKYKELDPEEYGWDESEPQELSDAQKKELERRFDDKNAAFLSRQKLFERLEEKVSV